MNFKRLNITLEDINNLEQILRKPPINSNISNIGIIKEQVPDLGYGEIKIMLALIKKKYGLCREEVMADDNSGLKQTTLKIDVPTTSTTTIAKQTEATNSNLTKPRELPNWLKRPSDNETKEASNQDKEKSKKKPKFM